MIDRIQRFEILERLGAGAMGVVYRARDPQLEREVALKVLQPDPQEAARDDRTLDLRRRSGDDVLAEARAMAQLSHPNVVAIYEVGREAGAVFLVVELVAGADLRRWLETPRELASLLDVLAQAARGLVAAHERGVVHGDLKPDNILIGHDGRARVGDFGLAELVVRRTVSVLRIGDAHGTPDYMAPEVARGGAATFASDVFALCATALEALTGTPFTNPAGCERALAERGVPRSIRRMLATGLAPEPAHRPRALELAAALAGGRRRRAPAVAMIGAAAVIALAATHARPTDRARPPCTDDRTVLAGRWDDDTRTRVAAVLAHKPALGAIDLARRVLSALDARAEQIVGARRKVCEAERRGELGGAAVAIRSSCWERRAFDLGSSVRSIIEHPTRALPIDIERAQAGLGALWCDVAVTPPLVGDRTRARELHDRLGAAFDLPMADQAAALRAIETDASRAGESELAVRAGFFLGNRLLLARDYDASDDVAGRAYRGAQALRIDDLAARALVLRSTIATQRKDPERAGGFIDIASELIDHPAVGPRARLDTLLAAGARAGDRGNHVEAVAFARRGLDELASTSLYAPSAEVRLRGLLTLELNAQGKGRDAIAAARDNVASAQAAYGTRAYWYGVALASLAMLLIEHEPGDEATTTQRRAFEIMAATTDGGRPPTELACMERVYELEHAGSYDATYRACSDAHTACLEGGSAAQCAPFLGHMAESARGLGRFDEAVRLFEREIAEVSTTAGIDHTAVLELTTLAELELELDRPDAAELRIAAIERAYASRVRPTVQEVARLRGALASRLALARGRSDEAERASRAALASLGPQAGTRAGIAVMRALAASLAAQQRWLEARGVLARARIAAVEGQARPDVLAAIDVADAAAALGIGDQREGLDRARRAREILEAYPGQVQARREAVAILGR